MQKILSLSLLLLVVSGCSQTEEEKTNSLEELGAKNIIKDDEGNITSLGINNPEFDDNDLKQLKHLTKLTELRLGGTNITDTGLGYISDYFPELFAINLNNTKVSDVGMVDLYFFKRLKHVYVEGTAVTDLGVRGLQKALPECTINR